MADAPILSSQSIRDFFRDMLARAIENQRARVQPFTELYVANLLHEFLASEALYLEAEDGSLQQKPLAFLLKEALEEAGPARLRLLRRLGDTSLFISGFFPDSLARRSSLVDVDYYIAMGGRAYDAVARHAAERSLWEELHVALFLDDSVLAQLARTAADPWTQERLSAFCAATEGISHFLYVAHRARQGGQVSQLELEAQGEIDKYLAVLMQLWATGRRSASRELRRRLFERTVLRPGLSAPERDRYRFASALAAACARAWEARYVLQGRLDALLREARRMYRLAGGEKFSAFAHGAVAWAA